MESQGQPCFKGFPTQSLGATKTQNDKQESINSKTIQSSLHSLKKQVISTVGVEKHKIPRVLLDDDEDDENEEKHGSHDHENGCQRNLERSGLDVRETVKNYNKQIDIPLVQSTAETAQNQIQIPISEETNSIDILTMKGGCHGDKEQRNLLHQNDRQVKQNEGIVSSNLLNKEDAHLQAESNSDFHKKGRKNKAPMKVDLDNLHLVNPSGEYSTMDSLPSAVTMTTHHQDTMIDSHGYTGIGQTVSNKRVEQSQGAGSNAIVLANNETNQKDIETLPIHVFPQGQGISLVTSSGILTADISTFSTQVPTILTEGDEAEPEQFHVVTTSNMLPGNPQGQASNNEILSVMMSSNDLTKGVILTPEQQEALLGEVINPGIAGGQTLHITIPNVTTTAAHQVSNSDDHIACNNQEGVDNGQVRAIQVQLLRNNPKETDNKGHKAKSCSHQDCEKACHRVSKLKMPTMINPSERPYKCPHEGCEWAFATAYKLKRHERGHTGERPFLCPYEECGRRFTTAYNLKTHVRSHTRTNTITCQYNGCDKSFPSLHKYRVHERKHQLEDKPFRCEVDGCGKEFSALSTLTSHLKSHSGERPHGCPMEGCDKRFTKASKLKLHMRTHTGERPFACDVEGCGWSFTSAYKLKRHMRKHTGERPFICNYEGCHKSFTRSSHLKTHTLVHTGEKPYVCPIDGCAKAFTAGSSLNVHIRKHTGEKPFRCEEEGCNKAYTTASNLRAHQKRHDKKMLDCSGQDQHSLQSDFVNAMSSSSSLVEHDSEVTYTGIHTFTSEDFAHDDVTTIPVNVNFPHGIASNVNQQDHPTDVNEDHSKVATVTLPVANMDVDGSHMDVTEFVVRSENVETVLHEVSKHTDVDHIKHDSGFDLSITSIVNQLQSHETSPNKSCDVLRGERLVIDSKYVSNHSRTALEFRTPVNPEDQFKPPAVIFQEDKSGSSDTEGEISHAQTDLPTTNPGLMHISLPQEVIQIHFPPHNSPVPPVPQHETQIDLEETADNHQLQAYESSSLSDIQGHKDITPYMEEESPEGSQVDSYPESTINLQDLR